MKGPRRGWMPCGTPGKPCALPPGPVRAGHSAELASARRSSARFDSAALSRPTGTANCNSKMQLYVCLLLLPLLLQLRIILLQLLISFVVLFFSCVRFSFVLPCSVFHSSALLCSAVRCAPLLCAALRVCSLLISALLCSTPLLSVRELLFFALVDAFRAPMSAESARSIGQRGSLVSFVGFVEFNPGGCGI